MVLDYKISSVTAEMDVAVIHGFISNSYWAKGIPITTMEKAIQNSLCFGIFTAQGEQVAFARMISDKATFAYLSDVFVLAEHRGKGLSKWLLQFILKHPELQGLRRVCLATSDAHELYKKFNFKALASPQLFMECHHPNVYK